MENESGTLVLFNQILNKNLLNSHIQRISCVPRAREIRWFHNMAEDDNSDLYLEHDITEIKDLLQRVRESFSKKKPES